MGILRADRITGLGGANAITGSTHFAGSSNTGNYLRIDTGSTEDFTFGTGDFTFEFWIYSEASGFQQHFYDGRGTTNDNRFMLYMDANSSMHYYGDGSKNITSSSALPKGEWVHVALVRASGSTKMYWNGTQTGSTYSDSIDFLAPAQGNAFIGSNGGTDGILPTGGGYFNGFLSNYRIVKGTAVYTADFTPPNTRLTAIDGTVLLTCTSSGNVSETEGGNDVIPSAKRVNLHNSQTPPVASSFTPNSPVGFSTTTDVGSQYGSTFDGFGSFATSTYMVPPGGNTRERNRGRGVFGGGFNGVSPNVTNAISYVEVQSGGIFKDFGDLTLARGYSPAGQTSSSTRGIFAGGYGGGGGYNTIDFITIANTGNAIDFGDISVAKFGQGGLSNQTRALFGGNQTAPFDNIIEFVTIATTGNAQDFGDLVKQRGLTAGASSSTRGVFTGGRSNTPSSNAQDNIMEYVTIATTGNTQDFGDLSTTTRYGHTGFSSPTRGISAGGFDPSGQAKTIDYFTIATLGNSSDFGDLSAVTGYCGSVTNSTRGAVTINNQPNYYNTLEFITIATTGDAQDFGDADVGSSKGHGDFPACASDSHGGVA